MSEPTEPITSSPSPQLSAPVTTARWDRGAAAEAAAARQTEDLQPNATSLAAQRDLRLSFQRLCDPGIMRPNSKEKALDSCKTLLSLADNIIKNPNEPKYRQFKPHNPMIKQRLVDAPGAVEYAVAMGFRAEVRNFDPMYVFTPTPKRLVVLEVGATVLRERVALEAEKVARAEKDREDAKAAREHAALQVKLAFEDDRKTKADVDRMERERRERREAVAARRAEAEAEAAAAAARGDEPLQTIEAVADDAAASPSVNVTLRDVHGRSMHIDNDDNSDSE